MLNIGISTQRSSSCTCRDRENSHINDGEGEDSHFQVAVGGDAGLDLSTQEATRGSHDISAGQDGNANIGGNEQQVDD